MTVHFIGAGPGAADLITVRGLNLIREAGLVLYAGSLVPEAVVAEANAAARVVDSAPMTLDEIIAEIKVANASGLDVARVHSGDPALYGAIAEQMHHLDALGIDYDVTPGVSAYSAAAAALKCELTLPGIAQTVVLTRTSVRSSDMPEGEDLETLAKSGATLAIHLSINNLGPVVRTLAPVYGADCPVRVVYRASWPDEKIISGTLSTIREAVKAEGITRTALIMVGRVFGDVAHDFSKLYDPAHHHVLRPRTKDQPAP